MLHKSWQKRMCTVNSLFMPLYNFVTIAKTNSQLLSTCGFCWWYLLVCKHTTRISFWCFSSDFSEWHSFHDENELLLQNVQCKFSFILYHGFCYAILKYATIYFPGKILSFVPVFLCLFCWASILSRLLNLWHRCGFVNKTKTFYIILFEVVCVII